MKKIGKNSPFKFHCKFCDYSCVKKSHWTQHIKTVKHKMIKNDNKNRHICSCGRSYKFQSGLSRHIKMCPSIVEKSEYLGKVENTNEVEYLKKKLLEKENENKELVNTICAMAPKIGSNNNNNNISINVFLNEHCKNAMSLADFVNQVHPTLKDILRTTDIGFANGVSNILIKNLNNLPSIKRPIHCSDPKRLKFYIKDEKGWNIDASNTKVDNVIETVTKKQIKELRNWEVKNPDYLDNDQKLKQWQIMIRNIMGPSNDVERDKDNKYIMKQIGENTILKNAILDYKS